MRNGRAGRAGRALPRALPLALAVLPLLAAPSAAGGATTGLLDPLRPKAPSSPAPSPAETATPTVTVSAAPSPEPEEGALQSAATGSGLTLSVPAAVSLGSFPVGSTTITGELGPVTVRTSGGALLGTTGWVATVSTTGFGAGDGPGQGIAPAAVTYRAGLPTALSGVGASACAPAGPVVLSAQRTAFSCSGLSLVTGTSVTWSPSITITLSGNPVGTYSGTLTHSVA